MDCEMTAKLSGTGLEAYYWLADMFEVYSN
jgi:hypothetical protein